MRSGARTWMLGPLLAWLAVSAGAGSAARAGDDPAAAPQGAPALVALLDPIRKTHGVPGMAGAVLTSKGLVAIGAIGNRSAGADAPVTAGDVWHIGSCTKSMTATLIGRLVEQRKLRWDTTLAEALPDLATSMHADWKDVTLELLLANRSGAPRQLDAGGLWGRLWRHDGPPRAARRLLTREVLGMAPGSKPGTKYEYSNAGFAIAGHVAESVMKMPYEALLRAEVFDPLQIRSAGFGAPGSAQTIDQPRGHREIGGTLVPVPPGPRADNPPAISPAGRVHLTLQDWARYIRLHLAGARAGTETLLLKRATVRRLQTAARGQPYALGWSVQRRAWADGLVLTHNGSNTMWFAVTWIAPKRDLAVVVACNRGGKAGEKATDAAARALIQWQLQQAQGRAKARERSGGR